MLAIMTARAVVGIAVLVACGSPRGSRLYPAGSDKDDGYGDLAQQSARLRTGDGSAAPLNGPHRHRARTGRPYGGDPYGAISDDDPELAEAGPAARERYRPTPGLTGTVEGTVTWRGAAPAPLVTACGPIDPGPRADRAAGVLVMIEDVELGRVLPAFGRPSGVGGTIAKRGCALAPALQIVTPLPAALAIHGDATEARLRVTSPGGVRAIELQAAGRVVLRAEPGVTRIEADDGALAAAWVVASDAPYYAITDDRGRFRIDELAAGTYDVAFWRPPAARLVDGKLVYGPPAVTRRSIRVTAARPARLDIALDR